MGLFKQLFSLVVNGLGKSTEKEKVTPDHKVNTSNSPPAQLSTSTESTEPMLTISQAAKKNDVTRQAIYFAIKMKRLKAKKENDTWMICECDLREYQESRYCRSKSRKEGELIFDKSKGFYSIAEAAKYLNRNTNHVYYLVRMGRLKTHRQGAAIVIQDTELHKYADFVSKKSSNTLTAS